MTEKEKHIENAVDAMQADERSGMETDMKIRTCDATSMEDTKDKDLCTSLQPTDIAVTIKKQDILRSTGSHPEKKHDVAIITDSCSPEVKATRSQKIKCAHHNGKTESPDISLEEDVPKSLLQDVQGHFSSDILALPSSAESDMISKSNSEESINDFPKPLVNVEEDRLSKTADSVSVKQSNVIPDTYSSCSDAISTNLKQYKSSTTVRNKYSVTSSVTHPSLPVAQGCASGDTSSLSSSAEKGSVRNITDETSVGNNFMSSVEKENGALIGGSCDNSDESGMSPEFGSNSVIIESISDWHKGTKTRKKVEFLDSQYKLGRDPSAINPSLSDAVILDLAGNKNVDASTDNMALSLDTEGRGTMKSTDDISTIESTISFHVTSNLHQAEYPSIPIEMAQEKDPDKDLGFSSCDTELVHEDSSDAMLQDMVGSIAGNSETGSAPEDVQQSRDKEVKHAIHNQDGSKDALELLNEDLAEESGKVPEASGISSEGNLKALASPIRGVIHDFVSLAEPNEKNLLNSCKKEEVSFSFQTAKKFLTDESSDYHCERACSGAGSDNVSPTIGKNDGLTSMSSNILSGITNGLENEVISLSKSHTTEELINFQDKKSEAVILQLERNLVSRTGRKLLVLDLNGLLADIVLDTRNVYKAQKKVGGKSVFKRPFCDDFLKFCCEKFDIGVWSSRRKYNVDSVLDLIMGDSKHKLLFCWDQSHCTYTGFRTLENVHKPLVLKELKKLWSKEKTDLPWEKGDYSASNTLLVDDSPYKALCNPPNTAIFPYPYHFDDENDTSLGPGGDLRVYLEGLSAADDVQLYVQEHPFGQQAITKSDSSWNFYLQVIEKVEQSFVPTE